jgi:hypothetical protein
MLWTLSMSVRSVLAKASELSPVKNQSSYHVADPGRAQTKRYLRRSFRSSFFGPLLSIYLPSCRDALRAIRASPGASQGLVRQLYHALITMICCALGAMMQPCLCGTPLESVSEGSRVFLFRLEKRGS